MFDFSEKTAIVTGGGGGIGRAACLALAKAGANVVVVDLAEELGRETVEHIKAIGSESKYICADVAKSQDVQNYVQKTLTAFGRIDIFFNNAGWEGVVKPIVEYPEDMFDRVLAINVRGIFLGLKYVLPAMISQRSGAVVNTASKASHIANPGMVAYTASKHAILGITRTAAAEVANLGIRVNAVCPGAVNTRMMRSLEEANSSGQGPLVREKTLANIPDGRYAEPEEVANLMLYLVSNLSQHIVGQGIVIDGGSIMR